MSDGLRERLRPYLEARKRALEASLKEGKTVGDHATTWPLATHPDALVIGVLLLGLAAILYFEYNVNVIVVVFEGIKKALDPNV